MPNPGKSIKSTRHNVEELVGRHAEALYSYALMRVQEKELAEDMVQETLLAALQGWERFSGNSSERSWLIGILRHKRIDFFRQHHNTEQVDDEKWRTEYFSKSRHWNDKMSNWKTNPAALAENNEFWQVLYGCLK